MSLSLDFSVLNEKWLGAVRSLQPPHSIGLSTCRFDSFHVFIPDQSIADIFLWSDDFSLRFSTFETFTNVLWLKERIVHPHLGY